VATPVRRLKIIERLAAAGIRVGINIAPVIPALNDGDIPRLLAAARDAGATHAGWVLLRLPGSVKQVFEERLRAALPLRADRVMSRIRETRGGALYDTRWRVRQKGEGEYAGFIAQLFATTKARLGYPADDDGDVPSTFRRPERKRDLPGPQLSLFPESDKSDQ
jgi:DNA repair photolyase